MSIVKKIKKWLKSKRKYLCIIGLHDWRLERYHFLPTFSYRVGELDNYPEYYSTLQVRPDTIQCIACHKHVDLYTKDKYPDIHGSMTELHKRPAIEKQELLVKNRPSNR